MEGTPQAVRFTKTVSEADVYLFAGLTGDFSHVHVDAARMAKSEIGERIAHGVLIAGLMSAASSRWVDAYHPEGILLSYGYDHMRFIEPVRFGDTITVEVSYREERTDKNQIVCDVVARNQHGTIVAVAQHLLSRGRAAGSESDASATEGASDGA